MPQLDTSTWSITIISMLLSLFIMLQLKVSKFIYPNTPEPKPLKTLTQNTPWEIKWTKIYSPLSLPPL